MAGFSGRKAEFNHRTGGETTRNKSTAIRRKRDGGIRGENWTVRWHRQPVHIHPAIHSMKSLTHSRGSTCLRVLSAAAMVAVLAQSAAGFVISTAPGLFIPSFRDPGDADAGQTTSFGWGLTGGRFDGLTDDDTIDNPPVNFSAAGLNGSLVQIPVNADGDGGPADILAGSNNIYASPGGAELTLEVPINGTPGAGFTTIIVQGRTAFGSYPDAVQTMFGEVAGVSPIFAEANNALGQGQFWAKYEIPGNAGSYAVPMTLPAGSSISIAELKVDSQFSTSGFAPDFAVVPEPSASLLALSVMAGWLVRRRRLSPSPAAA